jgi:hypothetical protein
MNVTNGSGSAAVYSVTIKGDAAEDQILPLILEDRDLRVKSFGRKTHNLEEVFLKLVGEENSK